MPVVSALSPSADRRADDASPFAPSLARDARDVLHTQPTLPRPGGGRTLERWRALAQIAARDLSLVKVLEAHYDAQAICAELDADGPRPGELWAVWAAEPPHAQVHHADGVLRGRKAWCSGADLVSHALLTVVLEDGRRGLAAVDLSVSGISRHDSAWQAIGMGAVRSGEVVFEAAPARLVGGPGDYLERPGFWHGGAGIAACWLGAAGAVAERLRRHAAIARDAHAAAHLGAIDVALSTAMQALRALAAAVDARPEHPHRHEVMQVRAAAEAACTTTLERVGRALGAGPLCLDREHAQRCADLTVFVRQTHAERDLQAIGEAIAGEASAWQL